MEIGAQMKNVSRTRIQTTRSIVEETAFATGWPAYSACGLEGQPTSPTSNVPATMAKLLRTCTAGRRSTFASSTASPRRSDPSLPSSSTWWTRTGASRTIWPSLTTSRSRSSKPTKSPSQCWLRKGLIFPITRVNCWTRRMSGTRRKSSEPPPGWSKVELMFSEGEEIKSKDGKMEM